MVNLPNGTVTFLFTDIEGSTRLWERYPTAMRAALDCHDQILHRAISSHTGIVFKTVGDAFCAVFANPRPALDAALEIQRGLYNAGWGETGPLRVRIALHTGPSQERDGDYFGPTVNRVARLLAAGHGGQTLLSATVQALVYDDLPPALELRDLGVRRLRDLNQPEHIFQLVVPDLPADFAPLRTLDNRPSNLPTPPTSFVGREQLVATVKAILRRPYVRLLTLSGTGGTGKTRLSLQIAADLLDEFEHGVFFVPLAAVSDPALVASTIAQVLGVKENARQPLTDSLKAFLAEKEMLLLLDNFEQVVEAAPLVSELLSAAPRLKVLVTSREVLNLYGEQQFEVPPLALPTARHELMDNEAVKLFVQRAQAVKFDFELTSLNALAIAQICEKLDGLPLAIELAAVRSKQFSPRQILEQLETTFGARLKLLATATRDLPARQQTLRGAIDWSYQLLDEREKTIFAQMAVFVGGCTIEAAQSILDFGLTIADLRLDGTEKSSIVHRPSSIVEALGALVDKSLLRQEQALSVVDLVGANSGELPSPRFVMLETIREYALERLGESGLLDELRQRHLQYFLALAEKAEPELKGGQQVAWMDRLEVEHGNLRAALSLALQHAEIPIKPLDNSQEPTLGVQNREQSSVVNRQLSIATPQFSLVRMSAALWRFWHMHSHLSEGRKWLEASLIDLQLETTEHSSIVKQQSSIAKALTGAGVLAHLQNDNGAALQHFERALALYRELDDKRGIANALNNLANIALREGDYNRAIKLQEENLSLFQEIGDKRGIANTLNNLGGLELYRRNYSRALPFFEECLLLQRELENRLGIAGVLLNLGCVMLYLADYRRGTEFFRESLVLFLELGDKSSISEALVGLAGLAGINDEPSRAACLFGAAEALRAGIGAPLSSSDQEFYEPIMTAARDKLGVAAFEKAWAEGRMLPFEQAITYALETC